MLHRIEQISQVPASCRGGAVSIGNFDGVHLGHAALVRCLRAAAPRVSGPAVVFTFEPHPVRVLRPERAPVPLTWLERKVELLGELGADAVIAVHTDLTLLRLTAQEFFEQVIVTGLDARALVEGPNFGFGRDRSGTITTLDRLCRGTGISLDVVDPLEIDGEIVSSTRVRQRVGDGDVCRAARLLGRPHRVRGRVVRGASRGAGLGFPTANLAGVETFLPGDGVYACRAHCDGESWPAAVHIGINATFGATERTVEAHLIGFQGDLAGRCLELDFLERLRGTQRFGSVDELVSQLRQDVARAATIE